LNLNQLKEVHGLLQNDEFVSWIRAGLSDLKNRGYNTSDFEPREESESNSNAHSVPQSHPPAFGKPNHPDARPGECTICKELPRHGSWSSEYQIPAQFKKLKKSGPLLFCPQCNNYYDYSVDSEIDDMSRFETYSLNRLSPPEILEMLPASEKQRYSAQLPA